MEFYVWAGKQPATDTRITASLIHCVSSLINVEHMMNEYSLLFHMHTALSFTITHRDHKTVVQNIQRYYKPYMWHICVCVCLCVHVKLRLTSFAAVIIDYCIRPLYARPAISLFLELLTVHSGKWTHTHIKATSCIIQWLTVDWVWTVTHANNCLIDYNAWPLLSNTSTHTSTHPFPAESMLKAFCLWDEDPACRGHSARSLVSSLNKGTRHVCEVYVIYYSELCIILIYSITYFMEMIQPFFETLFITNSNLAISYVYLITSY